MAAFMFVVQMPESWWSPESAVRRLKSLFPETLPDSFPKLHCDLLLWGAVLIHFIRPCETECFICVRLCLFIRFLWYLTCFPAISSSAVGATVHPTGLRASGFAPSMQIRGRYLTAAVRRSQIRAVQGTTPPTSTRWRWEPDGSIYYDSVCVRVLQNCIHNSCLQRDSESAPTSADATWRHSLFFI